MRSFILLCFAVVAAISVFLPSEAAASARSGKRRALNSVVQVTVNTRFGTTRRCSGYLFSPRGQVLTSFHAVSDASSITVSHSRYGVFDVDRIKRIDPRADVAVINLANVEGSAMVSAHIADSRAVKAGDSVYVLHHSHGQKEVIYSTAVLNTGYSKQFKSSFFIDDYASELQLIQLAGPFDAGSAGGLVCDENFDVIGILLGGGERHGEDRTAYALASGYFKPLLISTYDVNWASLQTEYESDADYFDKMLGPSPQLMDYQAPMSESYIAWFAPVYHAEYSDYEFTEEINDGIDKNWFATSDLEVDGKPIEEWSAARIFFWQADLNPWNIENSVDQYVYFDADSLFSKRIYKDRDTEERIVTRHIMAMPLAPGRHTISYENKGANYKSTGIRFQHFNLKPAQIELIDIEGLNLVSWLLLPNAELRAGEAEPVRYEVDKRPLQELEVNTCIRRIRYPVEF